MFSFQHAGPVEWIVVGLGNPGPKYDWTRHNVGFLVVDELADRANIPVQRVKYKALTNTTKLGGKSVLLMKPVTYMNLSGEAVGQAARFYKVPPERVLVISDDVSLPQGTDQFPRVKVGVGNKPRPDSDMAAWVLGKFTGPDREAMEAAVKKAADAVTCLIEQGADKAMAQFNG